MNRSEWIWMPHAGHFILGDRCHFRLNTYVGNYIVSTVGELPKINNDGRDFENIGAGRKYETFVFKAQKETNEAAQCCPYAMSDPSEIDGEGYNDSVSAYKGHLAMCEKWAKEGNE